MLKNKLELIRDNQPAVLVSWHKRNEAGEVVPVAVDHLIELDADLAAEVEKLALQPIYANVQGTRKLVMPGSSAHFLGLPKVLARLGFRTRLY